MLAPRPSNASPRLGLRASGARGLRRWRIGAPRRGHADLVALAQRLDDRQRVLASRGTRGELEVAVPAIGDDDELVPILGGETVESHVVEPGQDVALALPAGSPHVEEPGSLQLLAREHLFEPAHAGGRVDQDPGARDAKDPLAVEHLEANRERRFGSRAPANPDPEGHRRFVHASSSDSSAGYQIGRARCYGFSGGAGGAFFLACSSATHSS